MKELRKITITGKVKSVDFMYYAQTHAHKHHLCGYVQNGTPDRLYLEIEGEAELLDSFEKMFLSGFLAPHIESVSVEKVAPVGYEYFEHRKPKKTVEPTNSLSAKIKSAVSFFFS